MIKTYHLTKQYNNRGGFVDISLSVREGEVFSFLGKNGAGKSTFLRTLLGLLHKDSGEAYIMGKTITEAKARQKIGYLPELFSYPEWITGRELLVAQGNLFAMEKERIFQRIPEVLDLTGMSGHEDKKMKEYSKGMKQRIGLACSILPDTQLLFLDEPTSALDPVGRKHVRDIILYLKNQGHTVFLNTHLLSEAELVSDRIGIIDKGQLLKVGVIEELTESPVAIKCSYVTTAVSEWIEKHTPQHEQVKGGFEVFMPDAKIPELVKLLVNENIEVYDVHRKENMLETLFLETVGEEDSR